MKMSLHRGLLAAAFLALSTMAPSHALADSGSPPVPIESAGAVDATGAFADRSFVLPEIEPQTVDGREFLDAYPAWHELAGGSPGATLQRAVEAVSGLTPAERQWLVIQPEYRLLC